MPRSRFSGPSSTRSEADRSRPSVGSQPPVAACSRDRFQMAACRSNHGSLWCARSCAQMVSTACEPTPRPRSTGSRRTACGGGTRCSSWAWRTRLAGDEAEAELVFADAGEIALRSGANGTASVVLAERSLLALAHDDVESAEALLRVARGIVRDARHRRIRNDGPGACGFRPLCDSSRRPTWRRRRPRARHTTSCRS